MGNLLIASEVDPTTHPGGAGTYTRGLLAALRKTKMGKQIKLLGPRHTPPGSLYRSRQALALVQSCFSKFPAKVLFTYQYEFKMRLREIVRAQQFDVILINGSNMLWALDELPSDIPAILIEHNLEFQLLDQQMRNNRFISYCFTGEMHKHILFEIEGYRRTAGTIFLSTLDMAWGCDQVPGLRAMYLPPLFYGSPKPRSPRPMTQLRLGYLADFQWWPNRRNWKWLIEEIIPNVTRPFQLHVFGRQSQKLSVQDQVVVHGLVQDLTTVWDQVDIMLCPTRIGAGVNIKVAESLYNQVPVLATRHAVQAFQYSIGQGLMVFDQAEEWVTFLNSSAADELATQIPSEGLQRQFAVDQHVESLDTFLKEVIS